MSVVVGWLGRREWVRGGQRRGAMGTGRRTMGRVGRVCVCEVKGKDSSSLCLCVRGSVWF